MSKGVLGAAAVPPAALPLHGHEGDSEAFFQNSYKANCNDVNGIRNQRRTVFWGAWFFLTKNLSYNGDPEASVKATPFIVDDNLLRGGEKRGISKIPIHRCLCTGLDDLSGSTGLNK